MGESWEDFNEHELHGGLSTDDEQEEEVVEEPSEWVVLLFSDFPGVELVEDLHEDESVENDGIQSLSVCAFNWSGSVWDVQVPESWASKLEEEHDEELVSSNSHDLSPHVSVHDWVI